MNIDNADPTLTPEQALAEQLIHYINAKPKHSSGLCVYLSYLEEGEGVPGFGDSYSAVGMARKILPQFGQGAYVTFHDGPVPIRIKLAQAMLKLLEQGDLYFCPYWCNWYISDKAWKEFKGLR